MYKVGIVGATGVVGRTILRVLEERAFPVAEMKLFASGRSEGTRLSFRGEEITVLETRRDNLRDMELVFFAAGTDISSELAPVAVENGAIVVDKSNAFRMDPEVPLVVPEVNEEALAGHRGLIASPNCSTIQLVVALAPLSRAAGLRTVIVSTYQSVSGAGADALSELEEESRASLQGRSYAREVFAHPIAFNLIPAIDSFDELGFTAEEMKLVRETRKILSDPTLAITATAVRVPVRVGHSEAVTVELENPLTPEEARRILAQAPGVVVADDPAGDVYPVPVAVQGRDEVYVGRIREGLIGERWLNLWVVADNLRKGAATNAVQIAEALVRRGEM